MNACIITMTMRLLTVCLCMYLCIYTCVRVSSVYMKDRDDHEAAECMQACMYARIYTYIHLYMWIGTTMRLQGVCMYVSIQAHAYVYIHVQRDDHVVIEINIRLSVRACMHLPVHVCIHTCKSRQPCACQGDDTLKYSIIHLHT
jgi:hypothetical protein